MMSIPADHWIDQMFPTPILTVRALSLGWISSALKVTKIQAAYHQTSVIQMSKFGKSWLDGVSTPKSTGFLQVQSCKTYFEKLMLMELFPTFFLIFFKSVQLDKLNYGQWLGFLALSQKKEVLQEKLPIVLTLRMVGHSKNGLVL